MSYPKHTVSRIFGILVAGLLLSAPAAAQQGVPQQQQEPVDVEIDDSELETVAEAYMAVTTLTDQYNQLLQDAESAEEAQQLQTEYAEESNEAVQDVGLTVERYDQVIRAAQSDDELRNRLMSEIEEQAGPPEGQPEGQ